jgi:hypothetical protein
MCRNIKPLFNFDPPATDEEIRDAALQYVRKISGFTKPSTENVGVFETAINQIFLSSKDLLSELQTHRPKKDLAREREKAVERNRKRFGTE